MIAYATDAAPLTDEDRAIRDAQIARALDNGATWTMHTFDSRENESTLRRAIIQNSDPHGADWRGQTRLGFFN